MESVQPWRDRRVSLRSARPSGHAAALRTLRPSTSPCEACVARLLRPCYIAIRPGACLSNSAPTAAAPGGIVTAGITQTGSYLRLLLASLLLGNCENSFRNGLEALT